MSKLSILYHLSACLFLDQYYTDCRTLISRVEGQRMPRRLIEKREKDFQDRQCGLTINRAKGKFKVSFKDKK